MPERTVPLLIVAGLLLGVAGLGLAVSQLLARPAVPLVPEADVTLDDFMTGLACIESSGNYDAVNSESGALGKYQIMPRNWRMWARRILDDPSAEPSPENQEIVARVRIERLRASLGSWRRVAYWWLTGQTIADESSWSDRANSYVASVMEVSRRAATPAHAAGVPERCRPVRPEPTSPLQHVE